MARTLSDVASGIIRVALCCSLCVAPRIIPWRGDGNGRRCRRYLLVVAIVPARSATDLDTGHTRARAILYVRGIWFKRA
jgi:hypothetical protein